jgi:hypothetical protein
MSVGRYDHTLGERPYARPACGGRDEEFYARRVGLLVDRDADFAALDAALGGLGSTVLVSGEAGIGKTSLVRAFATRANRRVVWAYCERVSASQPLAPFGDLAELVEPPSVPPQRFVASREFSVFARR